MGTCEACAHWQEPHDHDVERAGMKRCAAVRPMWEVMEEATDKDEYESGEAFMNAQADALRNARAVVNDGSSYQADLYTRPDFGCVLFAPTTPKESP